MVKLVACSLEFDWLLSASHFSLPIQLLVKKRDQVLCSARNIEIGANNLIKSSTDALRFFIIHYFAFKLIYVSSLARSQ